MTNITSIAPNQRIKEPFHADIGGAKLPDGRALDFASASASACDLFAPSSLSPGALSGSLPFAAIIAIVGLGQLLVVQQGGFDLSLPGAVSLAVVVATHYPQQDDALLCQAVLVSIGIALAAGVLNGLLISLFRLNAIIATIGTNALLYGVVFAVSGGVRSITTNLLAATAGGEMLGAVTFLNLSKTYQYLFQGVLIVVAALIYSAVRGRRAGR